MPAIAINAIKDAMLIKIAHSPAKRYLDMRIQHMIAKILILVFKLVDIVRDNAQKADLKSMRFICVVLRNARKNASYANNPVPVLTTIMMTLPRR